MRYVSARILLRNCPGTSLLFLSLLTHDNSYDEYSEQMNAYEKSVTKKKYRWKHTKTTATYRLFVKFFNHLALEKKKKKNTEQGTKANQIFEGKLSARTHSLCRE